MEKQQFTNVAPFYDALMAGVPYKIWVRYIHDIMSEYDFKPHRVLELACGTGNVSFLMAEMGYQVTGVDLSEYMIQEAVRKAKERKLPVQFYVGDLRTLDLPEKDFDLELCLFDSLNYILDQDELQEAFTHAAAHLREGGLFIFDVNTVTALAGELFTQENTSPQAEPKYIWKSHYDLTTRISRVDMQFTYKGQDYYETHYQRAYELDELEMMLKKAGFHTDAIYEAYTFRKPLRRSDRAYFVARRRRV